MAKAEFLLDPLSAVMILVVTGVGFVIHIYSIGYMHAEDGYYRFFAYMNLFPVLDADPGPVRQLPADVRRMGRRGALLVSADRLLLRPPQRGRRREKGLHRQPHRRCRIHSRHIPDIHDIQHPQLRRSIPADRRGTGALPGGSRSWSPHGDRPAAVRGSHGQKRADPAVCLAAGCDGRPDAGQRPDPCRHHGHGRRLHGRSLFADIQPRARSRWKSSWSSEFSRP